MSGYSKERSTQIPRRAFLKLLGILGLGILTLPSIRARPGPEPLAMHEANYYRREDQAG
jgi:hypothetical protein